MPKIDSPLNLLYNRVVTIHIPLKWLNEWLNSASLSIPAMPFS